MTILQAVVLGLTQGVTEFLPISSSAHLFILPRLLGWNEPPVVFDVLLHLATLFAIFVALRGEIATLVREALRGGKREKNTLLYVGYATIPALAVGFFVQGYLDTFRTMQVVAWSLIVWGVLLWMAQWVSEYVKRTVVQTTQMSFFKAVVIGCAQVLAFIPGTSRSGVTMTTAIFLGADRPTAAVYSFLLGIPAIAAAGAAASLHAYTDGLTGVSMISLGVAFITAFVSGVFAIRFFVAIIRRGGFTGFALYRIILGLFLLLFV